MIILIGGKQGSGKTSLSNEIKNLLVEKKVPCWQMSMDMPVYDMHRGVYAMGANYGIPPRPDDSPNKSLITSLREWGRSQDDEFWLRTTDHKLKQVQAAFRNPALFHVIIIEDVRYENELAHWPKALSVWLECPAEVRSRRSPEEACSSKFTKGDINSESKGLNRVIDTEITPASGAAKEVVTFFTEKMNNAFS